MDTPLVEQFPSTLLHWLITKGSVILVVLLAMYVEFLILQWLIKRMQSYIEGSFPEQAQVQRVQTLT